jgi:hypothetical protein
MGRADTALSLGEWVFKVAALVGISAGGIFGWILASLDPFISGKSELYWYAIALVSSLAVAFTIWLVFAAMARQALAKYYASLSLPKSSINPLSEVFTDMIIPIEDLRLPSQQVHKGKHFRNCKFVGPAAIAIQGGSYINCDFNEYGDIVALPAGTNLVGLVFLLNCHVEQCEFVRTTIFADSNSASGFKSVGARVKGLT